MPLDGLAAWNAFLDLLYPPRCVACGAAGDWFCPACAARVVLLRPPFCPRCGLPRRAPGLCRACRAHPGNLAGARSLSWHEYPLREAVHALKYEGVRVVAKPLGRLLAGYWAGLGWAADLIVPVPLHARRVRQRGFNQAEALARALAEQVGIPLAVGALLRQRDTASQVGLDRHGRRQNVQGAFCAPSQALAGACVLLVDDVCTTGATLEAAAAAALAGGAAAVRALTLTRARDANP